MNKSNKDFSMKNTMKEYLAEEVERYHHANPTHNKNKVDVEYVDEIRITALLNAVNDLLKKHGKSNNILSKDTG